MIQLFFSSHFSILNCIYMWIPQQLSIMQTTTRTFSKCLNLSKQLVNNNAVATKPLHTFQTPIFSAAVHLSSSSSSHTSHGQGNGYSHRVNKLSKRCASSSAREAAAGENINCVCHFYCCREVVTNNKNQHILSIWLMSYSNLIIGLLIVTMVLKFENDKRWGN